VRSRKKALVDALHIAVTAVSGVGILLTWSFKRIAAHCSTSQRAQ
jgi:hypothetical protein